MPRHLTLTFSEPDDREAFVSSMHEIGADDYRVNAPAGGPVGFVVHQRGTESGAQSASRLLRFVEEVRDHAGLEADAFEQWVGANPERSFQTFPGYRSTTAGAR